jgi:hypothetical protein
LVNYKPYYSTQAPINIPKEIKEDKTKFIDVYLHPLDLYKIDVILHGLEAMNSHPANTKYSILIRVCYGETVTFKMLGFQYTFRNSHDPIVMRNRVNYLSQVIIGRLKTSMDEYTYNLGEISTIQLIVYRVDSIPELVKAPYNFNLSELDNSEKELLDTAKYKLDLAFKRLIPATMDEKLYNNLVLITPPTPEASESEVQGKEVPESVVVDQEGRVTTDIDLEHSQKNDHQSVQDLITSVNPNTIIDGDTNLYKDTTGKYFVSVHLQ